MVAGSLAQVWAAALFIAVALAVIMGLYAVRKIK